MSAERLQKVLASAGVASRRDCEELISSGRVTVNGQVMTELGARVDMENDEIAVDGKPITQPGERTYMMLNKPVGVVATADDPQGRPTVVELVDGAARLFPVGGSMLTAKGCCCVTDDGELTHRLTHPSFEVEKEYRVLLNSMPSADALRQWREGVMLEGERTAPAWVEVLESSDGGVWVRVVLREGRKRQIREVAALLGYEVLRLIRVREDTLLLGELPSGESRPLTEQEISALKAHTVVAAPRAPASRTARATRKPAEASDDERQPTERASGERSPRARTPYGRGEDSDRAPRSSRDEGDFRERRGETDERESAPPSRRDDRWSDRASRSNDRRDERPTGGRDSSSQRDGGYRDQRSSSNDRRESAPRRDESGSRDRGYGSNDRRDDRSAGGRDGGYRDQRSFSNDRRESGSRRDEGGYRDRSAPRNYGSSPRRDDGGYRDQRSNGNDRREGSSAPRGYNSQRESNYRDQRDQRANDNNDRREGNFRRDEGSYRDRSSSARVTTPIAATIARQPTVRLVAASMAIATPVEGTSATIVLPAIGAMKAAIAISAHRAVSGAIIVATGAAQARAATKAATATSAHRAASGATTATTGVRPASGATKAAIVTSVMRALQASAAIATGAKVATSAKSALPRAATHAKVVIGLIMGVAMMQARAHRAPSEHHAGMCSRVLRSRKPPQVRAALGVSGRRKKPSSAGTCCWRRACCTRQLPQSHRWSPSLSRAFAPAFERRKW